MPVTLASVDFPKRPGVYLFKTNKGRVLYVGKATKLNERIRSYFAQTPDRQMIPELVRRSDDIECIVMGSHKPGFSDYLLGSTAARVVRHAPCAVHVYRST